MWDRDISFRKDQSFLLDGTNSTVGRSCIVFYQTPIIHNSKQTRQVSGTVMRENSALCDFLREKKGVIDKEGLHKVNELFNYQMWSQRHFHHKVCIQVTTMLCHELTPLFQRGQSFSIIWWLNSLFKILRTCWESQYQFLGTARVMDVRSKTLV